MAAGTCPQPVEVGRRRVAWRDVRHPKEDLEAVTETHTWMGAQSRGADRL